MDARERIDDPEEALRALLDAEKAKTWTSAPATVISYNAAKQTVSLQLAVKSFVKKPDGSQEAVDIPPLEDVPVQFPGGGGQTMTFPIKPGDEGLVNFSSRSPDSWQQSGAGEGGQVPTDSSTNSLSGGFFIPGFRSNPRALTNVSESETQIRSDDGNTKIGLSGSGGVNIDTDKSLAVSAAAGVSIGSSGGETVINGTVRIVGELIVNDIIFSSHKHTGVQPGAGTSTGPTN